MLKNFARWVLALTIVGLIGYAVMSPVPASCSAFVGCWFSTGSGDRMRLDIGSSGHISYFRSGSNGQETMRGYGRAWQPDSFQGGFWPFETRFHVDTPPHAVGRTWHMTINGVDLERE